MSSTQLRLLIPALLLIGAKAGPQTPAPASRAPARGPVIVSPEVLADRRVTVRFYAPQAQRVTVNGLGEVAELIKGDNGVWDATVGPLVPGAYRYGFIVDGAYVIDTRVYKNLCKRSPHQIGRTHGNQEGSFRRADQGL